MDEFEQIWKKEKEKLEEELEELFDKRRTKTDENKQGDTK